MDELADLSSHFVVSASMASPVRIYDKRGPDR